MDPKWDVIGVSVIEHSSFRSKNIYWAPSLCQALLSAGHTMVIDMGHLGMDCPPDYCMSGSPENWGIGVWRPYLAVSERTSWGAVGGERNVCVAFRWLTQSQEAQNWRQRLPAQLRAGVWIPEFRRNKRRILEADFSFQFCAAASTSSVLLAGYCSILFHEYTTVYSSSVSGHLIVSNFCLLQTEQL